MEKRAAGYGIDYVYLDGNDAVAVADTMTSLLARLRERPAPVLVEAETYRWHGHYEGDPQRYREEQELTE